MIRLHPEDAHLLEAGDLHVDWEADRPADGFTVWLTEAQLACVGGVQELADAAEHDDAFEERLEEWPGGYLAWSNATDEEECFEDLDSALAWLLSQYQAAAGIEAARRVLLRDGGRPPQPHDRMDAE